MKIKEKNKEIIMLVVIILVQTIIFVIAGINKSYIHMDEAYSLGLANYDKVEIQENNDFYDTWHNKEYYEDYLSIDESEKNNFLPVYENQKNDVHPPLYYLLLRIAMGLHLNSYSKWTGIILNIIIYIFITIFTYLTAKKLLYGMDKYKEKSAIITLISSVTLASINNAIYIRMYALSTLNIIITTYLHLKLLDKKVNNNGLLIAIGFSALVGSLTHYYYLFYLAMLFIMIAIKYIKEKEYRLLAKYIFTMFVAGVISIVIFPYSIQHMFLGYRGQGVISNLTNIPEFLKRICQYLLVINVYAFNNILFILLIFLLIVIIYKKRKNVRLTETKNKYTKYILFPTIFYTVLVALSAPWIELRYIMPVCNLIFILIAYFTMESVKNIMNEKIINRIMITMIILIFVMPIISNKVIDIVIGIDFRKEQESMYSSKKEIVETLKNESNIPINIFSKFSDASMDNILLFIKDFKLEPQEMYSNKNKIIKFTKDNPNLQAIYFLNSSNNRFLDDILLFANIKKSYIAKDIECNEENVKEILLNKDIAEGILIFINDGQENEKIIETVKSATNFSKTTYLKRLNACDVYLMK